MKAIPFKAPTLNQLKVLLIEDNVDGRESLKRLLELWGYHVVAAEDGSEGVRQALIFRPSIVISDIGMPNCDGYEVARQLRASLGNSVVLIALTGYGTDSDRKRAMEAGF